MMADSKDQHNNKTLAVNRRVRFNYDIEERLECGVELKGTEVKSIKAGNFQFSDAYARIRDDELYMVGFHVSPYKEANLYNHDPDRERKLLAHKKEIVRLRRKIDEQGYTLVPTRFFLTRGIVKVELGLGKGKKLHDKRHSIKSRDIDRETEREIRSRS